MEITTALRHVGRFALAGALVTAGVGHLRNKQEFLAQVPPFFPAREAVVDVSGFAEIALGTALAVAPQRRRGDVGRVAAAFFVLVFPGNVSQLVTGTEAFGLDTTTKRAVRLVFQPLLVLWALWATGPRRR